MNHIKNYNIEATWTQPYRTYGCLWESIETVAICDEMDELETQLRTTALAKKMLNDIGVSTK